MSRFFKFLIILTILSVFGFDNIASPDNKTENIYRDKSLTNSIDSLCQLAWDLKSSNSVIAIEYANEALLLARESRNNELISKALFYLGSALIVAGQPNPALKYLEEALKLIDKNNSPLLSARIYNGIGLAKVDIGEYTDALDKYNMALNIYREIKDTEGIALQLQNIGVVHHLVGRTEDALNNYLNAIAKLETLDDADPGIIANNYTNTAIIFLTINEKQKALEFFASAENIYKEKNDLAGLAHVYLNKGVLYFTIDLDSSLFYHNLALQKYKEQENRTKYATSLSYVADVYREKGEYEKSAGNYKIAIQILDEEGFLYGKSAALSGLGSLYRELGDYDNAIINISKALEIAASIDGLNLQKIALAELAETYYSAGDYKYAFDNYRLYKNMSDSLLSMEKLKVIKSLEYSYKAEKKQREIEKLTADQNLIKTRFRALAVIFFIVLMSLVIIINKQRIIRKKENLNSITQKLLAEEKLKLTESELKFRKKLLLNYALRVTEKNNLLSEISIRLKNLDKKTDKDFSEIIQSIKMNLLLPNERYELDKMTEQAGADFFSKIDRINPNLTLTEKKVCVFLSFGFNSKDISGIMNISSKTIDNYRSSIRKKLNIHEDDSMNDFFSDM